MSVAIEHNEMKIKDENLVYLNNEWVLCHQQTWILFFHIHPKGNYFCINGECSECGKEVPAKLVTLGKFKTI